MSTRDLAHSLLRRKPIEEIEEENKHSGLFRSLGLWQLTAIGVGGIIGVGIFSLAGLVAHGSEGTPGVGPAVLFSFLIAGLASAAAALSYAEFAGMIPRAGSAYTYGYVAIGEIIGWFIGWDLLLEYIAIVAVVAIEVLLILFIIGLGVFYIDTDNYDPFMPNGFGPVVAGAATVFFAVFGYDAMSTAAEEATDGKKHMPKAILLSLIIAMLLYVAATLVLTGMQNYTEIDPTAGFASAFQSVGLPVIATIIAVFAVLSILTVMLTFLLGVTRVWFSMSRDGLLPGWFSKTDRHGTPQRVTG